MRHAPDPATAAPAAVVRLAEWSTVDGRDVAVLSDPSLPGDAAFWADVDRCAPRIEARRTSSGIALRATSWVGQVRLGPLEVLVVPKLQGLPLVALLSYVYGWGDLRVDPSTIARASQDGLQDLLGAALASELAPWARSGRPRQHVGRDEVLASPRGRLLPGEIVRQGGVREPRLPCHAVERRTDWALNRVLKAGLVVAAHACRDPGLRRRLHGLIAAVPEVAPMRTLARQDVDAVAASLSRQTAAWSPALSLIGLLLDGRGAGADDTLPDALRPRGFLFDMNLFFQRLVSRFLREHLPGVDLADERHIPAFFRYERRRNHSLRHPAPRPDLALREPDGRVRYLDAKYRDLCRTPLPIEWLYQLSLYALASRPAVSVLLHASLDDEGAGDGEDDEDRLVVMPSAEAGAPMARVIVRPVPLHRIAALVGPRDGVRDREAARALARRLIRV